MVKDGVCGGNSKRKINKWNDINGWIKQSGYDIDKHLQWASILLQCLKP